MSNARLLRSEIIGTNKTMRRVFRQWKYAAIAQTIAPHDHDARSARCLQRRHLGARDESCPCTGHDDPPCARLTSSIDERAIRPSVRVNNVYSRPRRDARSRKRRSRRMQPRHITVKNNFSVGIDISEETELTRLKRLQSICVGFCDLAGTVDLVVEHDQYTLAHRVDWAHTHALRRQNVECRFAHCRNHHATECFDIC